MLATSEDSLRDAREEEGPVTRFRQSQMRRKTGFSALSYITPFGFVRGVGYYADGLAAFTRESIGWRCARARERKGRPA